MNPSIDLRPDQRAIVEHLLEELAPRPSRVWAFGSRARWTAKTFSDLDLAIDAGRKLSSKEAAALEAGFEESSLPWKVDVVDLNAVSQEFRKVIEGQRIEFVSLLGEDETSWRSVRLGDILELKRGYDLPQQDRRPGSVPIVSSSGASGFHDKAMAKAPGVVTGRYGTIGQVFFLKEDFWPLNTSLYVRDFKGNDPRFIYYLLKTLDWNVFNDKSGVPGVNRNHVHEAIVRVPDLATQRRVAGVLQSLDDKVDLNRQLAETLEEMARAIFRDWFVEFGPTRRQEAGATDPVEIMGGLGGSSAESASLAALFSPVLAEDGIPASWTTSTVGAEARTVLGGTPSRTKPEFWGGDVPWINSGKANEFRVVEPSEYITQLGLEKSAAKMLPRRTTLIAITGATLGQVSLSEIETSANQSIVGVAAGKSVPGEYIYLWIKENIQSLLAKQTGGAQQHINKANVDELEMLRPTDDVLSAWSTFSVPIFDQIAEVCFESRVLVETRDYLLPRLMSDRVAVRDAQTISQARA